MANDRLKISLGFIFASLIWGSTWLVIKVGLESIPPFYGAAFRFIFAVIILLLIIKIKKIPLPLDKESINVYLLAGLLSFSVPFAMVYWGQQFIPSGLSSILFALYPFFVGMLSHFFLPNEPLNVFKIIGVVLGFLGILMIFADDISWASELTNAGMIAIIGSSFLQALSLVLIKKYGKDVNPFHLNIGGMAIGVVVLLLIAIVAEDISKIKFDFIGIGSILYLGIFGSVVAFSIYFWMLKRVEAVYLSLLAFVTPILAVILGGIVLNEKLDLHIFQGASLVLAGILISNGKQFINTLYRKKSV